MRNNKFVTTLLGWVIIGTAYYMGKQAGVKETVYKTQQVLVDTFVNEKIKEEEA